MIPRELLAQALGGNPRVVKHFEEMGKSVSDTERAVASAVEATNDLADATVITLSANAGLNNERVLHLGRGLKAEVTEGKYTLSVAYTIPAAQGGFQVTFIADGDSMVSLPLSGRLATVAGPETLSNKTLNKPKMLIPAAADDVAAGAAGVPVGGVYHASGVLRIRLS